MARTAGGGIGVLALLVGCPAATETGPECTDADGDGYCAEGDCDDGDPSRHPGAPEVAGDEIDSDCDGKEVCYADEDADGYRTEATVESRDADCADLGEAGVGVPADDCDDDAFAVYPGAPETVGDEIDGDCDGAELCWADADGDGFRDDTTVVSADVDCKDAGEAPYSDPTDCNDQDPELHELILTRLVDGFSLTENSTTSVWSYRYTATLDEGAPYALLPVANQGYLKDSWDPGPQPRLWSVSANTEPWMGVNDTSTAQALEDSLVPVNLLWPADTFVLAPGPSSKAVVGWRAQVPGTAAVTATFADVAVEHDGVEWSIELDALVLASGQIDASGGSVSSDVVLDNFPVEEGDIVYFVVDPRGPGDDACSSGDASCNDATELDATVALCAAE